MSGFNLGALVVAFIALLFLANLGSSILTDWQTPASNGAPVGGSLLPAAPAVEAQPVTLPGNPQPVAVMPVPATTPPPPSGNPNLPLDHN
ncbi:MAG TPA: hypothetical protein VHP58_06250 [Alphaproteobacteria bacterium]|nr:hypothetical protein [Alphaproteobacteria bacterium]